MWAGFLNETIDVMKYTHTLDNFGDEVDTLTKVYSTRAKVNHLSGSRTVRSEEIQYPYTKIFVVRYHTPITEDNYIKWQDKLWRIQAIDRDRKLQQTVVQCEIVNE